MDAICAEGIHYLCIRWRKCQNYCWKLVCYRKFKILLVLNKVSLLWTKHNKNAKIPPKNILIQNTHQLTSQLQSCLQEVEEESWLWGGAAVQLCPVWECPDWSSVSQLWTPVVQTVYQLKLGRVYSIRRVLMSPVRNGIANCQSHQDCLQ